MRKRHALRHIVRLTVATIALLGLLMALDGLQDGSRSETLTQVETAVRQACMACYAIEGRYPQDVQYMRDGYGLAVDQNRYMILYQVFANNVMPVIKVLEVGA